MLATLLIDGNNLGHVLGYIDKAAGRYDGIGLLSALDGVARYLAAQGQEVEIVLFLDDVTAAERLTGWRVQVAAVPEGDADAAIRAFAQTHADNPQILVSADQVLCNDAAMWGVVCLSPHAFISRYIVPARRAGFYAGGLETEPEAPLDYTQISDEGQTTFQELLSPPVADQGEADRRLQITALKRAEESLRGEPLAPPEVYRLDLSGWTDAAELALYLAEHHLCPDHRDLTAPAEMIATICEHCSRQLRYFTSGRVINRVFRLFLCRPEHTLSLNDLARLAQTRRRKIRAAIEKHGERLGIVVAW